MSYHSTDTMNPRGCIYVIILESLIIPAVDPKNVEGCPELMRNYEENGVIHKIKTQYDSLEFITMSEAGYQDFNILIDDCRQ